MRSIDIYTRDDCIFCTRAKMLLIEKNLRFTQFNVPEDLTRDELKERFPDAKTYPVIVIDGKWIGGFTELQQVFGESNNDV